jgi:tripartite-type tricarboxylate transporter receptor subunit TctC
MRILAVTIGFMLSSLAATSETLAQAYPSKPVRLILGNAAGGPTDLAARAFGEKMQGLLGQPFVVESRPGAGTLVATQAVAQAQPDGYTLLYGTAGVITGPALSKTWTLDAVKDLTPISQLVRGLIMVASHPAQPYKTADEWIAYARANPGKLNYANISATDLVGFEMVRNAFGLKWETVRYNGAAPAQTAVMAGQADFYAIPVGATARSLAESGKIRLLAVMAFERSKIMPQVPSFGESSSAELRELSKFSGVGQYWFSLMGPGGLPRTLVNTLHQAAVKASADADYVRKVAEFGLEIVASTPEAFTSMITTERVRFAAEAKKAGLEPQ